MGIPVGGSCNRYNFRDQPKCSRFGNQTCNRFRTSYTRGSNYAPAPNPNPSRWEVLETYRTAKSCVLKVRYKDCTNYEGIKIMVYDQNITINENQDLDPHFCKGALSPIARFKPTQKGWDLAIELANKL